MNIFAKRPLGLILCIFLCGFTLSSILPEILAIVIASLSLIAFICCFCFKILNKKILKISFLTILVSVLLSFIYFNLIFYPTDHFGKEYEIVGTVTDMNEKDIGYTTLDLSIDSIDGKDVRYKTKIYYYHSTEGSGVEVGDRILVNAALQKFEKESDFNTLAYYTSIGVSSFCSVSDHYLIEKGPKPILYVFKEMRNAISERALELFGEEAGGLIIALLLGERNHLTSQLSLDFKRIGITHILALSGMNVAILAIALDKILSLLGVNKKLRYPFQFIFVIAYMALTGFPVTVVRAGVMMIISSFLTLISRTKDGITNLCITSVILVLISPYSALDISLWLSVLATLGILCADYVSEEEKTSQPKTFTIKKKLLNYLKVNLLFSVFALASTFFITVISFNSTSTVSVITTMLFSLIIEVFIYIGIFAYAISGILNISGVVTFIGGIIADLTALISKFDFVFVSTEFISVKIIGILSSLLFFALLILKLKKKRIIIPIVSAAVIFTSVYSFVLTEFSAARSEIIASSYDNEDKIIIKDSSAAFLLDNASYRSSSGYNSSSTLYSSNVVSLDTYCVTQYTTGLPAAIKALLSTVRVDRVIIPLPNDEIEELIAYQAIREVQNFRCEITFYKENEILEFNNYEIICCDANESSSAYAFLTEEKITAYLSRGALENCYMISGLLYEADELIFGGAGKKYEYVKLLSKFGERVKRITVFDEDVGIDSDYAKESGVCVITGSDKVVLNQ